MNIVKVDRVAGIDEARQLETVGVDIIGVSLIDNPSYDDSRTLEIASALAIKDHLKSTKLAVEVPPDRDVILAVREQVSPDYIQLRGAEYLSEAQAGKLELKDTPIVFAGIEASYDDDPSWIISGYNPFKGVFYQIDLLGNIEDSWNFFKTECPKYPEELQIADIVNLGKEFPLLISIDFTPENVNEILNAFSTTRGISLTLSEKVSRADMHSFKFEYALDMIRQIKR